MYMVLRNIYAVPDDVILERGGIKQLSTFKFLGSIIVNTLFQSDSIQYIKKCPKELVFCIKQRKY